jgi:hypothetical protein
LVLQAASGLDHDTGVAAGVSPAICFCRDLMQEGAVLAGSAVKTDHWFYGLFQSAPDLITLLLPGVRAASLGPDAPGDALYRFEAPELKDAP